MKVLIRTVIIFIAVIIPFKSTPCICESFEKYIDDVYKEMEDIIEIEVTACHWYNEMFCDLCYKQNYLGPSTATVTKIHKGNLKIGQTIFVYMLDLECGGFELNKTYLILGSPIHYFNSSENTFQWNQQHEGKVMDIWYSENAFWLNEQFLRFPTIRTHGCLIIRKESRHYNTAIEWFNRRNAPILNDK